MKKFTEDAALFKMDGGEDMYTFGGVGYEKANKKLEGSDLKKTIAKNWIEPPKRERERK
jgi:SWI/SNF-related matrix-associated actin-dependent regulator of chromatin subfamily A member 5